MKDKKLLCAVGDKRYIYACSELAKSFRVCAAGCGELPEDLLPFSKDMKADALVLPLLNSAEHRDGRHFIRCMEGFADLGELLGALKDNAPVFGALADRETENYIRSLGHSFTDCFKDEELIRKNALPTAEAALEIAMQKLEITVSGTKTLVIGFGRVARECARLFGAAGSEVTCAVRRKEALSEAELAGHKAFLLPVDRENAKGFDIVINTVPALVLDKDALACLDGDVLIIDLASKPGGTDFPAAKALGLKALHALALPGKYAPKSAGRYIAQSIERLLSENLTGRVKDET